MTEKTKRSSFYITDLHDAPFSFFQKSFWKKKSIEIDSDLKSKSLKNMKWYI